MEQGTEAKPGRLAGFLERLRREPPQKQGAYALAFAALATALFVGAALAARTFAHPGGDGSIAEGARQLVSVIVNLFRASAPTDSEL